MRRQVKVSSDTRDGALALLRPVGTNWTCFYADGRVASEEQMLSWRNILIVVGGIMSVLAGCIIAAS